VRKGELYVYMYQYYLLELGRGYLAPCSAYSGLVSSIKPPVAVLSCHASGKCGW
jgi:hypothetical protein